MLLPGLGLFVVVALFRTESWPARTILFNTIVIEFIFGVVLAKLTLRGWVLPAGAAAALVVAGFALILVVPQGSESLRTLTWGLPALAIVTGAVFLESRVATVLPRWLLGLGDASYSIYLTHGFALPVLGLIVVFFHRTGAEAQALTILGCLVVSAIVGSVVYMVVERPIMLSLKKWPRG